jgi:hypothetical protein
VSLIEIVNLSNFGNLETGYWRSSKQRALDGVYMTSIGSHDMAEARGRRAAVEGDHGEETQDSTKTLDRKSGRSTGAVG